MLKKKLGFIGALENWQGWQDLNLRMSESKSDALPLGDTPVFTGQAERQGSDKVRFLQCLATPLVFMFRVLVESNGLEPFAYCVQGSRSTR